MDNMAMLIDIAKCVGCRSCQVACKNWNQLKAEQTRNRGTNENPPDLSPTTWNRIRFFEQAKGEKISWEFFSDRCRHCDPPDCKYVADTYVEGAVIKDSSGAVVYTEKIKQIDPNEIINSCPYNIPRHDPATNMVYKCNLCIERISVGLPPACSKACLSGAIIFGKKEDMLKQANARVKQLSGNATLYPGEGYNVLWVLPDKDLLQKIS